MKKWNTQTAFGIDQLVQTLNWIETNYPGAVITQVILVKFDPELGELY